MSGPQWFRTATTGARVLVGAGVGAVVVLAVVAAVAAPLPVLVRDPISLEVAPAAAPAVGVCAGPLVAGGRNAQDAAQIDAAAAASVVSGGAAGEGDPATAELSSPGVTGDAGVPWFALEPSGGPPPMIAAAQSASVRADDLTGFAATVCAAPRFDSWLVAGATTTGSSDLLLIGNPGDVAATVDVTVFGAQGPSLPPGGSGLVVPAGTQLVVALAGLVLGEASPVVRVTASGSPVTAALQSSQTVTLAPVGVDVTAGAADAAELQVIPGVTLEPTTGSDASGLRLRLLAPGPAATVSITVTAQGAPAPASTTEVPLPSGTSVSLDIPGLGAGTYAVRIEADAPVVAGAYIATVAGGERDFAWLAGAPLIEAPTLVAVAPGPGSTLHIASNATAAVDVTLTPVDGGEPRTAVVPAGGSSAIPVPAGAVWLLEASAPVYASVGYAGEGSLAGYPVQPVRANAEAVRVYP